MKKVLGLSLTLSALLSVASQNLNAQQPQAESAGTHQLQQAPGQDHRGVSQQMMPLDQHIASCLLFGNQEEIALAEFAQSHASSEEVKSFAKMLVEDHKKAVHKLEKFAPHAAKLASSLTDNSSSDKKPDENSAVPPPARSSEASKPSNPSTQAGTRDGGNAGSNQAGGMMQQMLMMEKRVHEECLSMTQKELGMMQGGKFDHAYLGSQVGAHIGMLAKLKGSEEFASPELRQLLTECQTTVKKHKQKAEELMKESK